MKPLHIVLLACALVPATLLADPVQVSVYGALPDGRAVRSFTLVNAHGLRAVVIEYGAILASVETPDRHGRFADITLGYDTLEGWLSNTSYFGATVGRYANRIAGGKFILDEKTYTLATNNAPAGIPCHLHGGVQGFDKKFWQGRVAEKDGVQGVELTYTSPDGEEGYPGNLRASVTYYLTDDDELRIEFTATTDRPTPVNLANHVYWNLTGDPRETILGHELTLSAPCMLPVNAGLIPTGIVQPVADTPFDFTRAKLIGRDIGLLDDQLRFGHGYDHCWVLSRASGVKAVLHDPQSGRLLELSTNQPGLQFYSGNFLDGTVTGKQGVKYQFRAGLCLETQKFPDSPNHWNFFSTILRPGGVYHHSINYRFSTR